MAVVQICLIETMYCMQSRLAVAEKHGPLNIYK